MRVYISVPMSGKVFGTGGYPCCMQTFHIGLSKLTYFFRTFTKRSIIDHWIGCIVIYINDWSEIEMNSDFAKLLPYPKAHFLCCTQTTFPHSPQSHLLRKAVSI